MASNRLEIAVKRLTCCNILRSGFPSRIKVSFENTVEPVYNGHPRDLSNWPLNTGGRLIQDH